MSTRGMLSVCRVECAKLSAQLKVRLLLAACAAGPFVFAGAMRVQTSVPADTLFGRAVTESGFAVPLVVLGFGALWPFAVVASLVGGDIFASEDRYGTWTTVLTRSCGRTEVFAGKVLTAFGWSVVAVATLAVCSVAAGVLLIGGQPLVDLSGLLLAPSDAFARVAIAWLAVLPPTLGFTAVAVAVSVVTRSSAAGIGLPVLIGLLMQLAAFVDGPEIIRRLLLATAFGGWHGLFAQPAYYGPLLHGAAVSAVYLVAGVAIAYRLLLRRDIGR